MPTGFVDRAKGKGAVSSGWIQQFGGGSAFNAGGGQLNSTSAVSTAGGVSLSTSLVETTLLSYVLPANSLNRLGRNLLVTAYGQFSTTVANPRTAKLYFGSQVLPLSPSTAAAGGGPFMLQWNVFQTSTGNTQSLLSQQILSSVHGGVSISTGAEAITAASTIKLTGTSTQASAVGDIIGFSLQVEGLN